MRLKRLELQGFKSFLDRTILTFDDGITGVVGPNGCGKSNIVDAILWVMGEQSPKHLRGETMTDIIFNGAENKAPTSMAEVSLVLEREGIPLSPTFAAFDKADEISVTRRIYRDGTAEFMINKVACRLKDIHELFMDTGVGRRAYSIIEQGQIDRMINVKPEERRYLFEEVAGITKYKIKRKEAERKLDQTRQNLTRLQDIVGELEKQIRSLKVQAGRARKYKELKGELETVDLYLLGRHLYTYRRSIDEMTARRETLIATRSESDASWAHMDAEVTELEILRLDQEKAYQSLSQKERDLSLLVQKLESQVGLLEERRKYLTESQDENAREEQELEGKSDSLHEETVTLRHEREALAESLHTLEETIQQAELDARQYQEQKYKVTQKRDSLRGRQNQVAQKQVTLQNQRQFAESRELEIQERQNEINEKLTNLVVQLETQKQAVEDADRKIESCAERGRQATSEAAEVNEEVQLGSRRLSELEEGLFKSREEFHGVRSRLQSLTELQENLEGYSPTAREILLKLDEAKVSASPLAELIQPEKDVEDHLELLLGAEMNTLVVKTTEEAESLTRMVQDRGLERVRILALTELADIHLHPPIPGAVSMLSKVKVKPGFEAIARWQLSNVYFCDDVDSLFALRQQHPAATFLDTRSRVIGHGGQVRSLSAGAQPTKMGVFARRREIEELSTECAKREATLTELNETRERLLEALKASEDRHSQLKDKLSSLHIEGVESRKEREKLQMEASRTDRDYTAAMNDSQRNLALVDSVREQKEKCAEDLAAALEEQEVVVQELEAVEEAIEAALRDAETRVSTINEKKVERSRFQEMRNSLEYKVQKAESELEDVADRKETLKDQRARDARELESLDANVAEVKLSRESANTDRNKVTVEIADTQNAFNETAHRLQVLRDDRGDLQKKRDALLTELQELELKLSQEQSHFDHLKGISAERYEREAVALDDDAKIALADLPIFADAAPDDWETMSHTDQGILLQEHLKNLKDKVGRYGEVNLTAIQEFDEIQKRYDFLIAQKTDLESSIGILEEAIRKIDDSTKSRFEETFEAVDRKFREIFPILFNGGKAELTLVQAESGNPLEAGVDILVHPPGKRPSSITLLSGGEKALTAVSLVLAIFARKPSPFCLLDEVDAPLDDANVSRFNTVVRKMAEKTQFIVITHNKKTMEIAEALYGVTMEKAGISKMTSVRLN